MPFGALGCQQDVVQASDPATLQAKLRASFAARLVAVPDSQLIEIVLAGAGAGGIFQATIYYSNQEDGNYPPLVDQHVNVFGAQDFATMNVLIQRFYTTVAVDRTTFVEKAGAGAGAYWIDVIVYTLGEDDALAAMVDADEVLARPVVLPALELDPETMQARATAEIQRRARARRRRKER